MSFKRLKHLIRNELDDESTHNVVCDDINFVKQYIEHYNLGRDVACFV